MRQYNINGLVFDVPNSILYSDEKQIISVSRASGTYNTFEINGNSYLYTGGIQKIDYTDVFRANVNRSVTLTFKVGTTTQNVNFNPVSGITPTEFYMPPRALYYLTSQMEFYFTSFQPSTAKLYMLNAQGGWVAADTAEGLCGWSVTDMNTPTGMYRIGDTLETSTPFNVLKYNGCDASNKIVLSWMGENGLYKSYMFDIIEKVRRSASKVSLNTYNDGYNVIKDKAIDLKVIARGLNAAEFDYLADVVYSSEVLWMDDATMTERRVAIAESTISTAHNNKWRDLSFTINKTHYDNV